MLMTATKITRINHVRQLCDKRGWDRKTALREITYHANVTRPTAERAYNGETELELDTIEKLAALFGVTKEEVLESRFK